MKKQQQNCEKNLYLKMNKQIQIMKNNIKCLIYCAPDNPVDSSVKNEIWNVIKIIFLWQLVYIYSEYVYYKT